MQGSETFSLLLLFFAEGQMDHHLRQTKKLADEDQQKLLGKDKA